MTNENICGLASKCKKAGDERYCNNLCFPFVRMYGESGTGGVVGIAGIPKAYRKSRVDNLPFKDSNKDAYKFIRLFCKQVVEKVNDGIGLYLFSIPNASNRKGTGTGKTTGATAILNEYIAERVILETKKQTQISDIVGMFVSVSKFQNTYNAQFRGTKELQDKASETYYSCKGRMCTVPLLLLDDIGIRDATEAFKNEFYEIIDSRSAEQLSTLYTSNVPLEKLSTMLDERIVSRIEGSTYQLPFVGSDHRKVAL